MFPNLLANYLECGHVMVKSLKVHYLVGIGISIRPSQEEESSTCEILSNKSFCRYLPSVDNR